METRERTICLCMIVRDEAHVVRRALESARAVVDAWVVCDTGSTDGTPERVREAMEGVPGELHRVPWVDFGHNRTEAIRLAREKADYVLVMDADMVLNVHPGFCRHLGADAYEIRYEGEVDYAQRMLLSSALDWRYVGATHEYVEAPGVRTVAELPGLTLTHLGDGGNRADKFERDARLLEAALERDPDDERSRFYLAQSYRDLGDLPRALEEYERRAAMTDGWEEERWYAAYQAARMRMLLGEPRERVLPALAGAYGERPARLEPLHDLVRHLRESGRFAEAYAWAAQVGHGVVYPSSDRLFIDRAVYDHLLALEYGACACACGRVSEAVSAFNQVLRRPGLPAWVDEAARQGRAAALGALYPAADPPPERPNRLVVVSAFRDAGDLLTAGVESVLGQDHERFRVVYVDDASTDGCARHVPVDDPRVRLVRRSRRRGLAANLHAVVTRLCRPDDVVVIVDGDDRLAAPDALRHVDEAYRRYGCWLTYGQFRYADGEVGFCEPFSAPRDVAFQRSHWRTSHLKTFRAGLFHAVAGQDPRYDCLRGPDGRWLDAAVDAALMAPLVDMAGFGRVRYLDRVLYEYHDENPMSHHNRDVEAQARAFRHVWAQRPFARIDALPTRPPARRGRRSTPRTAEATA